MTEALLVAGMVLSGGLIALVAHNLYWTLQELMCDTHLNRPFWSLLDAPTACELDASPLFFGRWLRARRRFFRSITDGCLAYMALDSFRSHLSGVFALNGLWLTIPVTIYLVFNVIGEAHLIVRLRHLPEEAEAMRLARAEIGETD